MLKQLSLGLLALRIVATVAQQTTVCTADLVADDDCADVINPIACYNEFRFSGTRTLTCIDGKDNADRARKACKCCSCVGTQMCNWVKQNNLCSARNN
ncbi:hypothetical protein VTK73DRAFT_3371 [Phialemonium thermophilum]|uniref:Secreted protein n=1 Tax=Phialemonium thermophilum TaxID=223376 RepID=A0ABR3WZP5_9PEZI